MQPWIDPQMETILQRMKAGPAVDFRAMPIAEARVASDTATLPWSVGAPAIESRELRIPGPGHAMRARLYVPDGGQLSRLILYVHGGGWTFGSIDTHDGTMRGLAVEAGCPVLGIDYRLAPEHPFPAPLDDVLAAIDYVEQGGLGEPVRPGNLAIAGDSAGANLALAALIRRRDHDLAPLAAAALFYGCYEPDFGTASHAAFGGGDFLLTSANMRWYWNNFLGQEADSTASLAAPVRSDLSGLPPLYLSAAGLDPLRDDTIRLAHRLGEAGARFRFDHVPGVVHGCLRMWRELDAARAMLAAGGTYIADQLKNKKAGGNHPWNAGLSSS
ncbi:MAG TPA: alpha/beta hydrolase [Bosea sp. (in: a-proteobacteria)]|jgi:acetyl esterase|uniref:alpha/beta hydrolase n=1 Tax=Bosea sp. (in: a-proteobacteria) TaxID=1871050 RepID=UPI002E150BDF|nr:alpha/beta hydrolase [Bosea sp. (in: a-proteobacteria)]